MHYTAIAELIISVCMLCQRYCMDRLQCLWCLVCVISSPTQHTTISTTSIDLITGNFAASTHAYIHTHTLTLTYDTHTNAHTRTIAVPNITSSLTMAWVHVHGLLLGLSKYPSFATLVVEKGLLDYHMKELRVLRMNEVNWVRVQ